MTTKIEHCDTLGVNETLEVSGRDNPTSDDKDVEKNQKIMNMKKVALHHKNKSSRITKITDTQLENKSSLVKEDKEQKDAREDIKEDKSSKKDKSNKIDNEDKLHKLNKESDSFKDKVEFIKNNNNNNKSKNIKLNTETTNKQIHNPDIDDTDIMEKNKYSSIPLETLQSGDRSGFSHLDIKIENKPNNNQYLQRFSRDYNDNKDNKDKINLPNNFEEKQFKINNLTPRSKNKQFINYNNFAEEHNNSYFSSSLPPSDNGDVVVNISAIEIDKNDISIYISPREEEKQQQQRQLVEASLRKERRRIFTKIIRYFLTVILGLGCVVLIIMKYS